MREYPGEGYKDAEGSKGQGVLGVAGVLWFLQPRAEELRGGLLAAYIPSRRGVEGQCWALLSGDSNRTQGLGKGSLPEGSQALEQIPQGSGHSLKLL